MYNSFTFLYLSISIYLAIYLSIYIIYTESKLLLTSLTIQRFRMSETVGFRNGKNLKGYLVRAALPNWEQCGNGTYQACDHIITSNTSTPKECREVLMKFK